MNSKKGFTLVELLGVLSLLAIIGLIAYPQITSLLKKTSDNESNRFIDDISFATEAYIQTNQENFEELKEDDGIAFISFEELVKSGFLKSTMYDPRTKQTIKDELNYTVKVINNDSNLSYIIMSDNYTTDAYVQDALILHYDGYKKPISQDGQTIWKDLTGNNADGIINGNIVWNKNSLTFDGSSYIESVANSDEFLTVEIVSVWRNSFKGSLIANSKSGAYGFNLFKKTDNDLCGSSDALCAQIGTMEASWNWEYVSVNQTVEVDKIYRSYFIVDGINITVGQNELKNSVAVSTSSYGIRESDSNMKIGNGIEGEIYAVRIYNRVLAEEEINKNYQIDKIRFGIEE